MQENLNLSPLRYLDDESNREIVTEAQLLLDDIYTNIPPEEEDNIKMEVNAGTLCCVLELLIAVLMTYEGLTEEAETFPVPNENVLH